MLELLLSATVFIAVSLAIVSVFGHRNDAVRMRVRSLGGSEPDQVTDLSEPFVRRVMRPALEQMGERLAGLLPSAFLDRVSQRLVTAGSPFTLPGFMIVWMSSAVILPLAFVALLLVDGVELAAGTVFTIIIVASIVGFFLPYFWLIRRARRRQRAILKALPDGLDLVTTCVEAGLGLDAALAKLVEKGRGPLAQEIAQALREMALGRMRRQALRDVGVRTGVPELITFVNAVIHAEQTGASISQVLRVQADQMRMRRRQRAEAEAQRAPVWMTFPLVLFILPSLFIVVLGPAAINSIQNLTR